ncbi:MAG: NAD(P)/FAD-dependent oxidoreductase [Lachnospiraceae bacterium]|nr:NAD(P)/FAD-dependent oxidoreductase [Lachnospiraceae bacterium]
MAKYDVVVVGAGNAGLSAALQLLKEKKKILVIEQHNLPGGCASSFVRGRYEFDPSLHELCNVGSKEAPGSVRKLMEYYGVKVDWVKIDDCFRVISKYSDGGAMDVTMPAGREKFIDAMDSYVPGSREAMERLFDLFDKTTKGIDYVTGGKAPETEVLFKEHGDFLRTGAYPTLKVFKAVGLPQRAIDILSTYWPYLGVDLSRLNFVHYSQMIKCYIDEYAYIPKHTSHEISNAMLERIRDLGGEVWFNCRAEEFLFDGGKLCGVKTTNGTVECNYVLANINPDIVYSKMVPKEMVPAWQKKLSAARKGNYSGIMYTCYFGLDCSAKELGIKDYSIFFFGTSDSAEEYKNIFKVFMHDDFFILTCNNVVNQEASPEGTCIVALTTFTSADDWNDIDPARYGWQKSKVASELVRELKERGGIDISGHIEEMETASPLTFARYVNVPDGAVYGFDVGDWDSMLARMMTMHKEQDIPGLRLIGVAGAHGDGYNMAYANGQSVAMAAIGDLAKMESK